MLLIAWLCLFIEYHTAGWAVSIDDFLLFPANIATSKAAQAVFVAVYFAAVRCTLNYDESTVHAVNFAVFEEEL